MWYFMYICYALNFITSLMLLTAFVQSFFPFLVLQANHITFMILSSIVYFLTETLIIFFFVGTGINIKEYSKEHHLNPMFHQRAIKLKKRVYPPILLSLFLMSILFILSGAIYAYFIPDWLYHCFFLLCLVHFMKVKAVENNSFRDNTNIILEMTGFKPPVTLSR